MAVAAVASTVVLAAAFATSGHAQGQPRHLVEGTIRSHSPLDSSTNWAGYAVTSADPASPLSFTTVTGTWRATEAHCRANDSDAANAVWVGLGGYNPQAQALEQIGTDADCSPSGPPSYYAWYELVPAAACELALKIRPGDVIVASVSVKAGAVTLILRNRTRGTLASERTIDISPDLSSAEWIAEAPTLCDMASCAAVPLADFGTVTFSQSSTTGNGHAGAIADPAWSQDPIRLVPDPGSGNYFGGGSSASGTCSPAALTPDGQSFTISWAEIAGVGGC